MIREATPADLPALIELGRAMCAESPTWRRFPYNAEKAAAFMAELIQAGSGFAWVGIRDGVICAALLAAVREHWACDVVIAHELALFVQTSARGSLLAARLVAEFVTWAEAGDPALACAGTSTLVHPELTARLYERFGFARTGLSLERICG